MSKVNVEVEIPNYNIKYCDDVWNGSCCKFLSSFNYGSQYYCILSGKEITNIKSEGDKVCRPYGCRCIAKQSELI